MTRNSISAISHALTFDFPCKAQCLTHLGQALVDICHQSSILQPASVIESWSLQVELGCTNQTAQAALPCVQGPCSASVALPVHAQCNRHCNCHSEMCRIVQGLDLYLPKALQKSGYGEQGTLYAPEALHKHRWDHIAERSMCACSLGSWHPCVGCQGLQGCEATHPERASEGSSCGPTWQDLSSLLLDFCVADTVSHSESRTEADHSLTCIP